MTNTNTEKTKTETEAETALFEEMMANFQTRLDQTVDALNAKVHGLTTEVDELKAEKRGAALNTVIYKEPVAQKLIEKLGGAKTIHDAREAFYTACEEALPDLHLEGRPRPVVHIGRTKLIIGAVAVAVAATLTGHKLGKRAGAAAFDAAVRARLDELTGSTNFAAGAGVGIADDAYQGKLG